MKYIALEHLNFLWDLATVDNVCKMWKSGASIQEIVKKTKRREEEVFILLLDQVLHGKIQKRKNGIWGGNKDGNE